MSATDESARGLPRYERHPVHEYSGAEQEECNDGGVEADQQREPSTHP